VQEHRIRAVSGDYEQLATRLSAFRRIWKEVLVAGCTVAGLSGFAYGMHVNGTMAYAIALAMTSIAFLAGPSLGLLHQWFVFGPEFRTIRQLAQTGDVRAIIPVIDYVTTVRGFSAEPVNSLVVILDNALTLLNETTSDYLPKRQRSVLRSLIYRYPSGMWDGSAILSDDAAIVIIKCLSRTCDTESIGAIRHVMNAAKSLQVKEAAEESIGMLERTAGTFAVLLRASIGNIDGSTMLRPNCRNDRASELLRSETVRSGRE